MNCPKCRQPATRISSRVFHCEDCKGVFEVTRDGEYARFMFYVPDREAKLVHALQACLDALEEEARYTPWPTIPRKATNAIQEAKAALEEVRK